MQLSIWPDHVFWRLHLNSESACLPYIWLPLSFLCKWYPYLLIIIIIIHLMFIDGRRVSVQLSVWPFHHTYLGWKTESYTFIGNVSWTSRHGGAHPGQTTTDVLQLQNSTVTDTWPLILSRETFRPDQWIQSRKPSVEPWGVITKPVGYIAPE